jgi:hypothetical protein
MGPTRVSGDVDMKLSQAFMEPRLNSIPTTHVMKRIVFLKETSPTALAEFFRISTIILK